MLINPNGKNEYIIMKSFLEAQSTNANIEITVTEIEIILNDFVQIGFSSEKNTKIVESVRSAIAPSVGPKTKKMTPALQDPPVAKL